MVMSVTNGGGALRPGSEGLVQSVGHPFFDGVPYAINTGINLTKTVGQTITLQWAARNNGAGPTLVDLRVYEGQSQGTRIVRGGLSSGPVNINPGQQLSLDISGPVSSAWTPSTPLPAALVIVMVHPTTFVQTVIDEAFFTLTVTGSGGAQIVPVGSPVIS